jgi:hypothetical protein
MGFRFVFINLEREGLTVGGVDQRTPLSASFIGVLKTLAFKAFLCLTSKEIVLDRPL